MECAQSGLNPRTGDGSLQDHPRDSPLDGKSRPGESLSNQLAGGQGNLGGAEMTGEAQLEEAPGPTVCCAVG